MSVIPEDLPDLTSFAVKTGRRSYDNYIEDSASRNNVDPDYVRSVIGQESGFKPRVTSPKGASGLMQLIPATAKRFGVTDIYDPKQNIEGGTKYLKFLLDKFHGNVPLATAGYNAGEGAVEKYGNKIPPYAETQNYVKNITSRYKGNGYHPGLPDLSSFTVSDEANGLPDLSGYVVHGPNAEQPDGGGVNPTAPDVQSEPQVDPANPVGYNGKPMLSPADAQQPTQQPILGDEPQQVAEERLNVTDQPPAPTAPQPPMSSYLTLPDSLAQIQGGGGAPAAIPTNHPTVPALNKALPKVDDEQLNAANLYLTGQGQQPLTPEQFQAALAHTKTNVDVGVNPNNFTTESGENIGELANPAPLQSVDAKTAATSDKVLSGEPIKYPANIKTRAQAEKYVRGELQAKYPEGDFSKLELSNWSPEDTGASVPYNRLKTYGVNTDALISQKVAENRTENPAPDLSAPKFEQPTSVINRIRGLTPEQEIQENKEADPLYQQAKRQAPDDVEAEYLRLQSNQKLERQAAGATDSSWVGAKVNQALANFENTGAGLIHYINKIPNIKLFGDENDPTFLQSAETELRRIGGIREATAQGYAERNPDQGFLADTAGSGIAMLGDLPYFMALPGEGMLAMGGKFGASAALKDVGKKGYADTETAKHGASNFLTGVLFGKASALAGTAKQGLLDAILPKATVDALADGTASLSAQANAALHLYGRATTVGTVMGGTAAQTLIEGGTPKQAFDAAIGMGLFDIALHAKTDVKTLTGGIFQATDGIQSKYVTVTPSGEIVELKRKPDAVDAVIDVSPLTKPKTQNVVGTRTETLQPIDTKEVEKTDKVQDKAAPQPEANGETVPEVAQEPWQVTQKDFADAATHIHGTSSVNAENIAKEGFKLPTSDTNRHYPYSQYGADSLYVAPKNTLWFTDPDSGRMAKYDEHIPVVVNGNIVPIRSDADMLDLAKKAGYADIKTFLNDWDSELDIDPKYRDRSKAITDKLRAQGIDGIALEGFEAPALGKIDLPKSGTPNEPQTVIFNEKSIQTAKAAHRQAVERALKDGKDVPKAVLADYPDLTRAESPVAQRAREGARGLLGVAKGEEPVKVVEPAQVKGEFQTPTQGDKVFWTTAGAFGMPATVEGEVFRNPKGQLRVRTTGTKSVLGLEGSSKTFPMDERWTVKGDPEIQRRIDIRNATEKAKKEADQKERDEGVSRQKESVAKALKAGARPVTMDVPIGTVVTAHGENGAEKYVVAEKDADTLYGNTLKEFDANDHAPGSMGRLENLTVHESDNADIAKRKAVIDQRNADNESYRQELDKEVDAEKAKRSAALKEFDEKAAAEKVAENSDETKLGRLKGKKYKTANDETLIKLLQQRIAADPSKWKQGDGVSYKVAGGGKRDSGVRRGFRIIDIDPESKTATIRSVADTGITNTGGDYDRIPDQTIHIGDLARDRKYDAQSPRTKLQERKDALGAAKAEKLAKLKGEKVPTLPKGETKAEQTTRDAGAIAVPRSAVKRYAYADDVADQIKTPEFRKAEIRSGNEKPSAKTGFTKTQTEYLAKQLQSHVHNALAKMGMETPAEHLATMKDNPLPVNVVGHTEIHEPPIAVPDDGVIRIKNVEAANKLHQRITGKPIEGIGATANASVPSVFSTKTIGNKPTLSGKLNAKEQATLEADQANLEADYKRGVNPEVEAQKVREQREREAQQRKERENYITLRLAEKHPDSYALKEVERHLMHFADKPVDQYQILNWIKREKPSNYERQRLIEATTGEKASAKKSGTASLAKALTQYFTDNPPLTNEEIDRGFAESKSNTPLRSVPFDKTETPEFRKWFSGSTVVDSKGKPLVVYHGTNADVDAFSKAKLGSSTKAGSAKEGFFFTNSPDVAHFFADDRMNPFGKRSFNDEPNGKPNIIPAYLHLERPWRTDIKGLHDIVARGDLDKTKYDGVIATDAKTGQQEILVFEPTQIKSAIGNRGTFDPNDPSILKKVREQPDTEELQRLAQTKDFRNDIIPHLDSEVSSDAHGKNILTLNNNQTGELTRTLLSFAEGTTREAQPQLDGLFLDPKTVNDLKDAADGFAKEFEDAGVNAKPLRDYISNLEQAAKVNGTVRLEAFENARQHETAHQQSYLGAGEKSLATRYHDPQTLKEQPNFQKAFSALAKINNKDWKLDTATDHQIGHLAEESLMYLSEGQWDRLGLPSEHHGDALAVELGLRYAQARINEDPTLTVKQALKTFDNTIVGKYTEGVERYETNRKPKQSNTGDVGREGAGREGRIRDNTAGEKADADGVSGGKDKEPTQAPEVGEPNRPSSIMHAEINADRENRGWDKLSPRIKQSNPDLHAEVKDIIAKDPDAPLKTFEKFQHNPKAVPNTVEGVLLNAHLIDTKIGVREATRAYTDAMDKDDPLSLADAKMSLSVANAKLDDAQKVAWKGGSERGAALQSQKMFATEDFEYTNLVQAFKAAKGRAPNDAEIRQLQQIADEHKAKSEALEAILAGKDQELANIKAQLPPRHILDIAENYVNKLHSLAEKERERLRSRGNVFTSGIDPRDLKSVAIIGADHLANMSLDFAKWSDKMVDEFGDKIQPHLEKLFGDAQKVLQGGHAALKSDADIMSRTLKSQKTRMENRIKELENAIKKQERITRNRTTLKPDAELEGLQARVKSLKEDYDAIFPTTRAPLTDAKRLQNLEKRLEGKQKSLQEKVQNNDLSEPTKRNPLDPFAIKQDKSATAEDRARATRIMKAQAEVGRIEKRYARMKQEAERASEPITKWGLRKAVNFVRGSMLSAVTVIEKLGAASIGRTATSPVKTAVGYGVSKLIPGIARKAAIEGSKGFVNDVRNEAYATAKAYTTGIADVVRTAKGTGTDLSDAFGRDERYISKGKFLPFEASQFIGLMHDSLKSPAFRGEYERVLGNLITDAKLKGQDVDNETMFILGQRAYNYAQRVKFQEKFKVSDELGRIMRDLDNGDSTPKQALGAALHILIPIHRISTNVVKQSLEASPLGLGKGIVKAASAKIKGLDNLTDDQADIILRNLKNGSVGTAMYALGLFAGGKVVGSFYQKYDKDKDKDVAKYNTVQIDGVRIPAALLHLPEFNSMFMGATTKRIYEESRVKGTPAESALRGAGGGVASLVEEAPGLEAANNLVNIYHAIMGGDKDQMSEARYGIGNFVAGRTVPGIVRNAAEWGDQDANGHFNTPFTREPRSRKIDSKTFGSSVKTQVQKSVPWWRNQLPDNTP